MDNTQINIEVLSEDDVEEVNQLYNRYYNSNRTIEEFKWEFFDAPAGRSIYVVAKDAQKNKIVGTQAAIPIFLKNCNGEKFLSAKSEDTLVDPNYRGLKIFDKMYEKLFDECKKSNIYYIWGFTSAIKPFAKLGFETPFAHSQSLFVNSVSGAFNYLSALNPNNTIVDKVKIAGLTLYSKAASIKLSHMKDEFNYEVSDTIDPNKIYSLQERSCDNDDFFFILQDKDYLIWRILDNPYSNRMAMINAYKNKEVVATFILNCHKDNVWYIIQSMYSKQLDPHQKNNITKNIIHRFKETYKPALIRSWNFAHNQLNKQEIDYLGNAGFIYLNRGIHFVWKDMSTKRSVDPNNFIVSRIATQGVI